MAAVQLGPWLWALKNNNNMGAMSAVCVDNDDLKFKLVCLANGSVLSYRIVIGVL
jgi:hypothetical protein